MSKVLLIHGPNLNLLGTREPEKYGYTSSEDIIENLRTGHIVSQVDYFQSNSESELVDKVQQAASQYQGILINAGAFSHTSVALADALRAIPIPKIAVHITNIYQREDYRHKDLTGEACDGAIVGLGVEGYALALDHLNDMI